jgi:hypothetical protein
MSVLVGIISDTHGVIRQKALEVLKGSDIIIHGGDIGNISIIKALETIAPVYAVKGNNDKGQWANRFPETEVVEINGTRIYVIHDKNKLNLDLKSEGFDIVIYGHSHRFSKSIESDVLFINPGGSGRKRFKLPLTVALLRLFDNEKKEVDFIYL